MSVWTPALDAALQAIAMETCFDWEETAAQLAAFSGHSAVFTGDEVRLRWAAIAGADEDGVDDSGDIDDDLMLDELIAAAEEGPDAAYTPQLTTANIGVATFELVEGYFDNAAATGPTFDSDDDSVHKLDSDDDEDVKVFEESAAVRELDAAAAALASIEAERRAARESLFQRVLTSLGGPSDADADVPIPAAIPGFGRNPVQADAQVHVSVTLERMKAAKPPSATSQALRAQRLAELQREREAMLAMIAPQVMLDVTGITGSDEGDSEEEDGSGPTAGDGTASELAEVLGILSQERRKRRTAGVAGGATSNPVPASIVSIEDPRLALGAVESKADERVSPRNVKTSKPQQTVRFIEPPAPAVDREVISTLLHSESGRELRSELAQLRHDVVTTPLPTPQLSYVVEAQSDDRVDSDAAPSDSSEDEDWSTLRQLQKRVASRAQTLLETVGVVLPTSQAVPVIPAARGSVDDPRDQESDEEDAVKTAQLSAAAQQELEDEWAWQARVEAEHERRMAEVLAETEAAKLRREAEIEAVMATQPPIFVFNEELLRTVTEQSLDDGKEVVSASEAKEEVELAPTLTSKTEIVPPPPLPSRRERKIAEDSDSDDSDAEVSVSSRALDHYRATNRKLPPLPPSPMRTAEEVLEGGAIESKSLCDDDDEDSTTPSAEAQKQRIAASLLSDRIPGTPLFEPVVSFLPSFPRVPPASAFEFAQCTVARMTSWSHLDSVAQCGFMGALFTCASQTPSCFRIIALELFCTPDIAPSVVMGFHLAPDSSVADVQTQLQAYSVAGVSLDKLITFDEPRATTRPAFESMFPAITGCHVLPCQSRSGDAGASRSSPDALTVSIVHNGLLQRGTSLTAVLNSMIGEGFELAGAQLLYPSLASCRTAGGCFVPTLATAGLPVLALCIRGKTANTAAVWYKLHSAMTVRVGSTPCVAVDDHNKPLLSAPATPAAAYKELALWFGGHVDPVTGSLPDYDQRTYAIAPAIISRAVVFFDASVHYSALITCLPKLAAAGLGLAGFGLINPHKCITDADGVPLWVKGSDAVIATIWLGDNAVVCATHALSVSTPAVASYASPTKHTSGKLTFVDGSWACGNAARSEEIAASVMTLWAEYPRSMASYRPRGPTTPASKLDTFCDQTVIIVFPAFLFDTLSSTHFNALGKRVGTSSVPPVVPILSAILQHGPGSVLSALLEANPLKSRGSPGMETSSPGGFAVIGAKTLTRVPEALKHVILTAVAKTTVPDWTSHLQGPVVTFALRRLDGRRKIRSVLGLDRDDGSKNALQDLLFTKYGLEVPSLAAVITSAVKVGDVLHKCFGADELSHQHGFPASADHLSLSAEPSALDWAIEGRRDSVAVTVVTVSNPTVQRRIFPRFARAVEDSGLKLAWVKLDVLADECAHILLRDESETNRKQLFPLLTSQVSLIVVLAGPCALARWLTLAGSSALFASPATSSQLTATACLCNIFGADAFVYTPQSQLDSLSLISRFTSLQADAIWQWSEDQPSLGGCDVMTSALNNTGRKLVRCSGPLLHKMLPSTPSSGLVTDIPIPPALKLKETTCLLLSPTVSRRFVDTTAASGDEFKHSLEDVLDVLLKDGFLMAALKLVRLSSDEASAFVSHQRKHSRSHSLSDLDYSSLLMDISGPPERMSVYDDEQEAHDSIVCIVIAVYRDNAVAHLRRIVEDGKEASSTGRSESLSVFGSLSGHVFPSLSIAGAAQELCMFFGSLCDGPDLIVA